MPFNDHPQRYALANELHARPSPRMTAPGKVAYLAMVPGGPRDRAAERRHLIALLDRFGASHPPEGATHHSAALGNSLLKWESHTEFVTYTMLTPGLESRPFDSRAFEAYPGDWLADAPGQRITSALIRVEILEDDARIEELCADWMVAGSVALARVLDDQAVIAGDFMVDAGGHLRFAVFARGGVGPGRLGRIVQRLCEIETYKTMAMLGLFATRELSPELNRIDGEIGALTSQMSDPDARAEDVLGGLLAISGELERLSAGSAYRFAATKAYESLVNQRIKVLRESRFKGRQTFAEFMMRRFDPAMRTVRSTETRLRTMSDRAVRASDLLRTRVDVERSAQNQALLESMDRRADLQLRLQQTVEGLSVVAISYYALNLVTYALAPLAKEVGLDKAKLTALAVLPVVGLVWAMIRRIHRSMH